MDMDWNRRVFLNRWRCPQRYMVLGTAIFWHLCLGAGVSKPQKLFLWVVSVKKSFIHPLFFGGEVDTEQEISIG